MMGVTHFNIPIFLMVHSRVIRAVSAPPILYHFVAITVVSQYSEDYI